MCGEAVSRACEWCNATRVGTNRVRCSVDPPKQQHLDGGLRQQRCAYRVALHKWGRVVPVFMWTEQHACLQIETKATHCFSQILQHAQWYVSTENLLCSEKQSTEIPHCTQAYYACYWLRNVYLPTTTRPRLSFCWIHLCPMRFSSFRCRHGQQLVCHLVHHSHTKM